MSMYLFLGLAFVCNAAANILLKLGATHNFSLSALFRGELNAAHFYTAGAILLFAANLGFYLVALRTIPLSIAYPVMVGMTFFITILASVFLGEQTGVLHIVGITLILFGMLLILQFANA